MSPATNQAQNFPETHQCPVAAYHSDSKLRMSPILVLNQHITSSPAVYMPGSGSMAISTNVPNLNLNRPDLLGGVGVHSEFKADGIKEVHCSPTGSEHWDENPSLSSSACKGDQVSRSLGRKLSNANSWLRNFPVVWWTSTDNVPFPTHIVPERQISFLRQHAQIE